MVSKTILQTIYPVVFEKEKIESIDCAGKKDEAIQKGIKGKCEVKEIENYPLAKGCGECYSADFFSINTNNMKPALYRSLENCNNGKNLSQTFLIFPAMQYFSIEKREIEKWENSLSHSDLNEPSQHQPSKKITPPKYVNLNGGLHELFAQYFSKPKMAAEKNIIGEVELSFVVEKDGALSNFVIEKDLGFGIGDEAIRVLAHLGKWESARFKKQPIRYEVKQTFEIL